MYRLEIKKGSIPAKKAETPPQNGLKLDYIFKLLHFNYLPPLIRCDCMIIARLVTLQLPSVIPACKRLLFVIPISSSVRVLKIAEIDPNQQFFFSNIRCTCITFVMSYLECFMLQIYQIIIIWKFLNKIFFLSSTKHLPSDNKKRRPFKASF